MPPIIGTGVALHDLRAGTGVPQNGQQACRDGDHRHHLWSHALDRTFHDGTVDIGPAERAVLTSGGCPPTSG